MNGGLFFRSPLKIFSLSPWAPWTAAKALPVQVLFQSQANIGPLFIDDAEAYGIALASVRHERAGSTVRRPGQPPPGRRHRRPGVGAAASARLQGIAAIAGFSRGRRSHCGFQRALQSSRDRVCKGHSRLKRPGQCCHGIRPGSHRATAAWQSPGNPGCRAPWTHPAGRH